MAVAVGSRPPFIERQTLCMAGSTPGVATHAGESDFSSRLHRNYKSDESNVAEQLTLFKQELSELDGEDFWTKLMEGMTQICHAQYAFVSKRILLDDHNTAIEMPRIGEEGSCLMAVAIYYNDGKSIKALNRDYKYFAWSCPCAYMKHDKVFLIEGDLNSFIQNNPNQLPFEPESYLGVPLFAEGKCFAHFGMMWTKEGMMQKTGLSWAFIEMFMHSLEDMITAKLVAGQGFAKTAEQMKQNEPRVIPHGAIAATQSLKLYARSLSHELRTPMQGVVGMLDLMYSAVQEQLEAPGNHQIRRIFQTLKNNIEVVQDSSKRAVEAADNVVHAYDLNMQIPETPSKEYDSPLTNGGSYFDIKPNMIDGSQIVNPHKRKRSMESTATAAQPTKLHQSDVSPRTESVRPPLRNGFAGKPKELSPRLNTPPLFNEHVFPGSIKLPKPQALAFELDTAATTPSLRQSNIREALPSIISDCLRSGGRPDTATTHQTLLGERIEVRSRDSNGGISAKMITWSVEPEVPYVIPIDERDLSKLIGAVFLNALKFTDNGDIDIRVKLSTSKRAVLVNVSDTGLGIPEAFQPELFKAFSKEDDSITRTREGLGLGLMVAKGLTRRIGGDLTLVRTAVDGPNHGSEFEIRIPIEGGEGSSRSTTPFRGMEEANAPRSVPPTSPTFEMMTTPQLMTPTPDARTSPSHIVTDLASQPTANGSTPNASRRTSIMHRRVSSTPKPNAKPDRQLASKYPLTFLVAEDNKINRKLLVQMLNTLGYKDVHEAFDGKEAVRVVKKLMVERENKTGSQLVSPSRGVVDVILMDLWMPEMDGYQATEQILAMFKDAGVATDAASTLSVPPTILAVSADVTDAAIEKATKVGMTGYMSKPFKVLDLQKLILEFCATRAAGHTATAI